ncbi:MAG: RagB/SusD family nutrient uptake outer membrane protein [Bacteroidales bacterium]|nr:RagB/SusD family nutrient uptake outer membrane protein [Bacteroidales bacterium]
MKKILRYTFAIILGLGLCSCDKLFDSLEGDLSKMSEEDMTSSQAGMEALLSDVYNNIPMSAFNTKDLNTTLASYSKGADYSIDVTGFWDYKKMRSINYFIKQVDVALEKKAINKATRDAMLGEALFVRAYCYFAAVRRYGGVPIVTEPLDQYYDGDKNEGLYVKRSTEKETWDFVISELDKAAELLPEERNDGKYRATKWAALGLQSRVALYAASVSKYWNKESIPSQYKAVEKKLTYMESSYADTYYAKCIEACDKIMNSGKFSLFGGATSSVSTAKENLTKLFQERQDCEFIFGKSYNNGLADATNSFDINYSPNQAHETITNGGWGNYSVTSDMVDLFDDYDGNGARKDGTVKTRNDGKENVFFSQIVNAASNFDKDAPFVEYARPQDPFQNKDARFQAWVLYPGADFRGKTIVAQGGIWVDGKDPVFYENSPFTVGDVTYYGLGAKNEAEMSAFFEIGKGATSNHAYFWSSCFGIRKFLDPKQALKYSTNPWYDIRYAEILLNYAEAVAESGKGDAAKAKEVLNDIRHRAAFTDDVELTLENVLHERRVEFAFEGHESYTLYRRREYLNTRSGNQYRKHTILPVLDLRDGSPKYIFARVNLYHGDVNLSATGLNTDLLDYYGAIPNFNINDLTPNPSQE